MSIFTFVQSVVFHFRHPVKMVNFCTGDTEFRHTKRRNIPLVIQQGITEVKDSNRRSPWYYNEPQYYPMSQAFEDWAYEMSVYKEPDYWADYDLDFD